MTGHQQRFAAEWIRRGLWGTDTIADALARTAARLPRKPAIVDGSRRITFAELVERSTALARALHARGLRPGDTVAYQLPNWSEAVTIVHAVWALGAIANPLLPAYGPRETEFILREAGARAIFIPGKLRRVDHRGMLETLRPTLPELAQVIVVRDTAPGNMIEYASIAGEPSGTPGGGAAADANDRALLIYTSGTTADPKGVLHTHNTLLAEAGSLEDVHGFTSADTVLMPLPLTHISGLLHAIVIPAVTGTTAVLMDRWDPQRAHELIGNEQVTYMVGPPVFVQDLCRDGPDRQPSFRLFSCGGADVTPDLMRRAEATLGCVAKRVYGSTEFPTLTTSGPSDPPARRHQSEGRAIGAAELRIVDDEGRPCPPGTEGEIVARGPECCIGYKNPVVDAASFDAADWFRTGDLGIVDMAGYLRLTGRKKDIIIRKGEKISAREVEELLGAHPDVAEAAVVGIPDPDTGERAVAVVRARPGAAPALEALTGYLRDQGLSTRKLPERLSLVSDFPRTASGKIHKAALRAQIVAKTSGDTT
jgi:cyclohexanecarboxylate-CoA ligase